MDKSAKLLEIVRAMVDGWPRVDLSHRATFVRNLVFLHRLIVASEPLLELAAERAAGDLRAYYLAHLEEERRHDEWLADDLASADVDVHACDYAPQAVAAAGSQYYLVRHVHPCALLGYMAVLECCPMALERVTELERIHGAQLCRTLRHHAQHDVSHGADLLAQIDGLSDGHFRLVMENAVQTALYLGAAIANFGGAHAG